MLAPGPGWRVTDIVCSSGPHDRPFEEQHAAICIAAVMRGSFQYRTAQGAVTLAPGAVLLGNYQTCFECGHDHGTGDRCLSFMFDPAYFETILTSVRGLRTLDFQVPCLPPLMSLTRFFADAEFARIAGDPVWFEQLALDLAATATRLVGNRAQTYRNSSGRDQRRVAAVLRHIESDASRPMSIGEMARSAAMSPYHFLRTFRAVTGTTPHQFILRARLQHAALQLRSSSRKVLDIALDAGFADLSTFNRRFRAIMGTTPTTYRRQIQDAL